MKRLWKCIQVQPSSSSSRIWEIITLSKKNKMEEIQDKPKSENFKSKFKFRLSRSSMEMMKRGQS